MMTILTAGAPSSSFRTLERQGGEVDSILRDLPPRLSRKRRDEGGAPGDSGGKDMAGCKHRIAVNRHRVFHSSGVASSVGDHHRDIPRLGHAKHQFIPSL